ncbi:MAG: dihydrolipoyl dehydrogenase [Ignavibacteriales bacterium CG_4_9_14_3_um_filter_34_10]|nr:MAG: dihydrolipoyl dehydrogenase [Ignavibacteriales bacterium CG_4_9_14_3_um_filter_34_10]
MSKKFDITILGGGPGGYVAAIRAAQLGFNTAIIEKEKLGGICLNWGCIPTKSLLKNAEVYDSIKNHAEEFGIKVEGVSFDFGKIIKRSRDVSTKITRGVEFLMKKNKVNYIKGFGKFIAKNKIEVLDTEGKKTDEIESEKIIIATGAHPKIFPNIPVDRKNIITSTEAMTLTSQPKDLIIIGAGAIGVEFAYFYNSLGTKVTIIEMLDSILPVEDREISKLLESNFKKRGIEIHTSTAVKKAEIIDGSVKVTIEKDGKVSELHAEKVLSAIGVAGNTDGYGLHELGIEIEKAHIKVDKNDYQTNIKNIFAIGDVIGPPWLAHVASAEGIYCVEKIKGLNPAKMDYDSIPGCTYCQPQVASIGLTEEKAKSFGIEYKVGKFPFMASGKSAAIGEREGFVKILFGEKYGEIIGAHIIGAEATELIAEIGIAKSLEATYETIVKTIHAHPTLSESIMEAAANAYGESIHI